MNTISIHNLHLFRQNVFKTLLNILIDELSISILSDLITFIFSFRRDLTLVNMI